jgi:uncharacterized protein
MTARSRKTRITSGAAIGVALAIVLVAALGAACEPRDPGPPQFDVAIEFDTARVVIETAEARINLRVEVASTEDERAYGLMERLTLPPDYGMLFLYPGPQPPTSGFWMFRTRIPLDIAFLDEAGQILVIQRMDPCASPNPALCPVYRAGVPYHAALEVAAGAFERWGVREGDRVRLVDGVEADAPGTVE